MFNKPQNFFLELFTRHKSRVAIENFYGTSIKYIEIVETASINTFTETSRKLVFCLADNDIGGVYGYLSLLASDAVLVMLNPAINDNTLEELIKIYQPMYIWQENRRYGNLTKWHNIFSMHGYSLFRIKNKKFEINADLALLLSTSGSTGSSKLVKLSYENLVHNAKSIVEYLKIGPNDIPITTLPLHYSYGISIIHSHIYVGAKIAVTKKTFFDKEFWKFFNDIGATSLNGVPYHYEMLKRLGFPKMNLPSLRTLTQAGGRLDLETALEFANHSKDKGLKFVIMYGQTEAAPRIAYLPADFALHKQGSIGIAIPGGRLSLEDEEGHVITSDNVTGELVYEGPNVFLGYSKGFEDLFKSEEQSKKLKTGDLAKRDKDGFYYIVGRLARFIKLFGHRINLADIENMLMQQGTEVICKGNDDNLEIYMLNKDESKGKAIKKLVSRFLKVNINSIKVYCISSFPRYESGKINYKGLSLSSSRVVA